MGAKNKAVNGRLHDLSKENLAPCSAFAFTVVCIGHGLPPVGLNEHHESDTPYQPLPTNALAGEKHAKIRLLQQSHLNIHDEFWQLYNAVISTKMGKATKYRAHLPNVPKVLFWDIPEQTPAYRNHPEWVIKRVFARGSMEDIADIIIFYGKEKVKEVLTTTPHLDEDILYLASAILGTPLNKFLSYSMKQYRKIF